MFFGTKNRKNTTYREKIKKEIKIKWQEKTRKIFSKKVKKKLDIGPYAVVY